MDLARTDEEEESRGEKWLWTSGWAQRHRPSSPSLTFCAPRPWELSQDGLRAPEESSSIAVVMDSHQLLAHTTATACQSRGQGWCQLLCPGPSAVLAGKRAPGESLPIAWMGTGFPLPRPEPRVSETPWATGHSSGPSVFAGLCACESPLG